MKRLPVNIEKLPNTGGARARQCCWKVVLLLCILLNTTAHAQSDSASHPVPSLELPPDPENLNVFHQWITRSNPGGMLMNHLTRQAQYYYSLRDKEIIRLKTPADWLKRQQLVRSRLREIFGRFERNGLLNPVVTGIVQKKGYRIEKIMYQSMPGMYVTGCIYLPDSIHGRVPAILNVMGHDQEAFRAALYQVIIINLVRKGMIVFAIDPPGQGERVQYYDPKVKSSSIGYSVIEHCYFGNQGLLSGVSPATYFIRDGISAIDYLLSRKDVDPGRIGVTGFSGGGTVAAYLAAIDERIKVSVPCSWSTASRRQLEMKGAQDAETVMIRGLVKGLSFEDLLEIRSPRPTLLTFVSRDQYLSLQGAREAFEEAKKSYRAFGKEDNLQMVEDDSRHWLTSKIRLAIYGFFLKHFGIPGNAAEEMPELPSNDDLTVTPTGQVFTSIGGKTIFDSNKSITEILHSRLEQSRRDTKKHLDRVQAQARQISGYLDPEINQPKAWMNGRYQREGYTVELLAISGEQDNYAVPVLLFSPNDNLKKHPAVVYLHPAGKVTAAGVDGDIEKLVKMGYVVAAADVIGTGETRQTSGRGMIEGYTALLLGRSIAGLQAGDIVRVVNFLKSRQEVDPLNIAGIASDGMCVPLLHAAAFEPSLKSIVLDSPLISYRAVAMNRDFKIGLKRPPGADTDYPYEADFSWGIASVLTGYDLPDLIGCVAPRKIILSGIRDQLLEPATSQSIEQELGFPRAVYTLKGNPKNLRVMDRAPGDHSAMSWLFE